jgi:hypothetical protein
VAVKKLSEDDFVKSLEKKTIIYIFYKAPIELEKPKQRPVCDKQEIAIYLAGIESTLPSKYKTYEDVFSKKEYKTVPEGTGVTHAINLKKEIKPSYNLIYILSERELRILRDYLKEKKIIGWIRRLKLSIEIFILFVSKPNGFLRLYINYRALNKVTVKNRYLLPLISETINRM